MRINGYQSKTAFLEMLKEEEDFLSFASADSDLDKGTYSGFKAAHSMIKKFFELNEEIS